MSSPFIIPGAPAGLMERINARRARIPAGMVMSATPPEQPDPSKEAAPSKPDGVEQSEWDALGDPGKRAIVRERARADQAQRDLAAALSADRLGVQKKGDGDADKGDQGDAGKQEQPDVAALIQQAVAEAMKPMLARDQQREVAEAAAAVVDSVRAAAKDRLHEAGDALAHLDLTKLTTDDGRPDDAKIAAALDVLVKDKPYLAKVIDPRRHYDPSAPFGGSPSSSDGEKVKAALARMQAATGVKLPEQS